MVTKLTWVKNEIQKLIDFDLDVPQRIIETAQDAWIVMNDKRVLNLGSNNYLGMANHPVLREASIEAMNKYGVGPSGGRNIVGITKLLSDLELELARFKNSEMALTFQSGYLANISVVGSLVGAEDVVFTDALFHTTLMDACAISGAKVLKFDHADADNLLHLISRTSRNSYSRGMIITDGVFALDGDIAPLPAYAKIAREFDLWLVVDDAHGAGVLGKDGRGIVDHFNLRDEIDVEISVLSKAFGVVGGVAVGKREVIQLIAQKGRSLSLSSGMTIPDIAACLASVQYIQSHHELIEKLWENTKYFTEQMKSMGFNLGKTQTPIVPVIVGNPGLAQNFSSLLFDEGVFVPAIVSYPSSNIASTPKARLRIINSATHSREDLDCALSAFKRIGRRLNLIPI
jgi:glycine C-acetyltransferase